MRTLPVLLLATGIVASLTSCATAPYSGGCDSTITSGPASSLVTAVGGFDSTPTVSFPTPLVTKKIERTELITGTGPMLTEGDVAVFQYTVLDGTTGAVVADSQISGGKVMFTLVDSAVPAVSSGLQCVTVGSRVAIASTAKDANQGDGSTDSYIFVVDVVGSFPGKAYGSPQVPQKGMPSVVTAPNGAPGITVPKQDPPATLTTNVLRQTDGAKLKEGEHVLAKFTALTWSGSSVFYSTWTSGARATTITLTPSEIVTKGLIDGLVGQHVGSQVLIVVPPEDGYGTAGLPASNSFPGVPSNATLIYVVDILGVVD